MEQGWEDPQDPSYLPALKEVVLLAQNSLFPSLCSMGEAAKIAPIAIFPPTKTDPLTLAPLVFPADADALQCRQLMQEILGKQIRMRKLRYIGIVTVADVFLGPIAGERQLVLRVLSPRTRSYFVAPFKQDSPVVLTKVRSVAGTFDEEKVIKVLVEQGREL